MPPGLSELREGIACLGLTGLSKHETEWLFSRMNRSKTVLLRKDEFTSAVKQDIPVALGKVVDVKEIVLDSFARSLADFPRRNDTAPLTVLYWCEFDGDTVWTIQR